MRISALFTRRIRGVRLVNVWGAGLLLVLVIGLYLVKTFAGGERADITSTEMQIADEQHKIRLLHAELAYLEQPARIERLSEQYLGMTPTSGKQEASVADLAQIARPPDDPKADAAAAAPAASSAPPASSAPSAGDEP
ncbi:MAG TPA: cell division protein [Caulobacteraceae bacterium]|jgi:cell division protein FtsL|nr:cell division protein [Caulobacteraceae bacterium]